MNSYLLDVLIKIVLIFFVKLFYFSFFRGGGKMFKNTDLQCLKKHRKFYVNNYKDSKKELKQQLSKFFLCYRYVFLA